jgi:AcrR family transcriptional regulator
MAYYVTVATAGLHLRKQDVVRDAIWGAAIDLFVHRGFEETTTEQIAAAAGVSPRTFFRYFASKSDLMGQGMLQYQALLGEAIRSAPRAFSRFDIVRHVVHRVAVEVASHARARQIIRLSMTSPAARDAQLAGRAALENAVADEFARRCRIGRGDGVTPRLLVGLTLSILDVTFREWAKRADHDIAAVARDAITSLTRLFPMEERA